MISEAMGKILGMVMAYGVSSLGLLLAYVNYRKRIVRAERVMSGVAWAVVASVFVVLAAGAWVVASLATPPTAAAEATVAGDLDVPTGAPAPDIAAPDVAPAEPAAAPPPRREESWSAVGLLVPGAIFFLATWVTAALHRRFSHPAAGAAAPPRA